MSDNAATEDLQCNGSGEDCPVHYPKQQLEPHELRDMVSRALVGLSARPVSMTVGQLTQDQVLAVCRALDVDPRPVLQLSIVAVRGGAQLVVWSHE